MSRKAYLPQTLIPGAQYVEKDEKTGKPSWAMPTPFSLVRHFKSEGARRKHGAGEIDFNEATRVVPTYRGITSQLLKVLKATHKYRQRQERRRQAAAIALQMETGVVTEVLPT